jgi:hypothetical protein
MTRQRAIGATHDLRHTAVPDPPDAANLPREAAGIE